MGKEKVREPKVVTRISQIGRAMSRLDRAAAELKRLGVSVEWAVKVDINAVTVEQEVEK